MDYTYTHSLWCIKQYLMQNGFTCSQCCILNDLFGNYVWVDAFVADCFRARLYLFCVLPSIKIKTIWSESSRFRFPLCETIKSDTRSSFHRPHPILSFPFSLFLVHTRLLLSLNLFFPSPLSYINTTSFLPLYSYFQYIRRKFFSMAENRSYCKQNDTLCSDTRTVSALVYKLG